MVTVVNLRSSSFTVYAGRPGRGKPGPFGNPFIVGVHGARGQCVELFRSWFHSSDPDAVVMREAALRLPRDCVLGCFCKPASCHADVIAAFINSHSE